MGIQVDREMTICSKWLQLGGRECSFTQEWEIHQYQIALSKTKKKKTKG